MVKNKNLGFIVDLDGTILDDLDLFDRTMANFIEYYDIEVSEKTREKIFKRIYEDTSNNSSKWNMIKLFLMVAKEVGIPIRKRLGSLKIAERSYKEAASKCPVIPKAEEALEFLNQQGTIGLLTTSSYEEVILRLDENKHILDFFGDRIVTGDMVKKLKPHPEGILKLIYNWGIDRKNLFMIGDMVTDIIAAKKVGIKTISVLTGYAKKEDLQKHGADLIFNSIFDVKNNMDKIFEAID